MACRLMEDAAILNYECSCGNLELEMTGDAASGQVVNATRVEHDSQSVTRDSTCSKAGQAHAGQMPACRHWHFDFSEALTPTEDCCLSSLD